MLYVTSFFLFLKVATFGCDSYEEVVSWLDAINAVKTTLWPSSNAASLVTKNEFSPRTSSF